MFDIGYLNVGMITVAIILILVLFFVLAYIPLYFTIKWAVGKALREVFFASHSQHSFELEDR